jgi:hypothetical protein
MTQTNFERLRYQNDLIKKGYNSKDALWIAFYDVPPELIDKLRRAEEWLEDKTRPKWSEGMERYVELCGQFSNLTGEVF